MTLANKYSEASIKSTWALIQFLIYWNWALIYVCWEEEKILIQDNLSETLLVLTFTLHIFLWFDIVPGVKPVKLSNVPMLVPLGIRRTGFYFLKMENKLLKGHFWNLSVKIYRNPEPLFGSRPNLEWLCLATRRIFSGRGILSFTQRHGQSFEQGLLGHQQGLVLRCLTRVVM